jgi:hypothetical protein
MTLMAVVAVFMPETPLNIALLIPIFCSSREAASIGRRPANLLRKDRFG